MSTSLSFAKAFGREKPHSSVTDWVDILTAGGVADEAYDGIPELVDAINLQSPGPTEACRALRKKLKHGNTHQQYRALVLLKALVENCGPKFISALDSQLIDALKFMGNDSSGDKRVKKKLMLVLASWQDEYKDDPSMAVIAGLYQQCKGHRLMEKELAQLIGIDTPSDRKSEQRKKDKREKEREALKARLEAEKERQKRDKPVRRAPFNFEQEKPKVLANIVDASQASSNLMNAITLVNRETESLEENTRVQECLVLAKQARKQLVRYIQLVEDEEFIGTLIETNERVSAALEMYDDVCAAARHSTTDTDAISDNLASMHVTPESEVTRRSEGKSPLHPDLEDLSFGAIGRSQNLPAPLQPSTLREDGPHGDDTHTLVGHGNLSDYSDYESSNEESHNAGPSKRRDYVNVSDNDVSPSGGGIIPLVSAGRDDPFADPFADDVGIGPSKRT